ncbi:hypothetical protein [uncultured Parasphingopyxis sp.]|uniref:hypothetical protein n=1 Tax=uncultured Parasphingopyxis sp. TaxID=1547918 RepID=UPI002625A081|nr:hypothetical protein [uncultured Parasphingopyxis sp.]
MKKVLLPRSAPNYFIDSQAGVYRIRPREKLLETIEPTESRIVAFNRLHEGLAVATELFQHHGDSGRTGVYRAMGYVMEYLTSRGIPPATLRPIEAVISAIVDAKRGTSSPIFEPTRVGKAGAPPKPISQLEFEGLVAVVVECCVRHCREEGQRPYVKPGVQLAARLINESDWPVQVTGREMEELRERVRQRKNRRSPDRIALDNMLASHVAQERPLDWARLLLVHQWVNPPPKNSS